MFKLEIEPKIMKALYKFADKNDIGCLYDMLGEEYSDEEIYLIDCFLENVYKTYEKDFGIRLLNKE